MTGRPEPPLSAPSTPPGTDRPTLRAERRADQGRGAGPLLRVALMGLFGLFCLVIGYLDLSDTLFALPWQTL